MQKSNKKITPGKQKSSSTPGKLLAVLLIAICFAGTGLLVTMGLFGQGGLFGHEGLYGQDRLFGSSGLFGLNGLFGQEALFEPGLAKYNKVISSSLNLNEISSDPESSPEHAGITQISPKLNNVYEHIEDRKKELAQFRSTTSSTTSNTSASGGYPDNILTCSRSGDDLLVLVNKQYQLPSTYAPSDLVSVTNAGIRTTKAGLSVRNNSITELTRLGNDATTANIDLAILSAYRSYSTQQSTYNYWVAYNGGNIAVADTISARPGHSQHQLGTAVDFTTNEISDQLGQHFGNTAAGQWLAEHAWEYGFALAYPTGWESTTGYSYEPWHFRYIGVENAKEWHSSGLILELWLREK